MEQEKKIIVISGPSGVGKTTMYKRILEEYKDQLSFSISATTRDIREFEEDGKDYYFLSEEKFKSFIANDCFIEWEKVYNNYYGTLKSEIYRIWNEGKCCLLDVYVCGGLHIKKTFGDQTCLIFIAPPSIKELESRIRSRGFNDEESLQRRLSNAKEEIKQKDFYHFVLENREIDETVSELKKIIESIL